MARITLNIEVEDAAELHETIRELARRQGAFHTYDDETERQMSQEWADTIKVTADPDAGATQDAEPGERQRRTRRTKAQIEADAAAALAAADPRLAGNVSGDGTATGTSTTGGGTSEADPFAQVDRQPTSSALQASPGSPTLQDLRKALADHMGAEGKDGSTARNALKSFKSNDPATLGQPCVRVSELHPADYAAAIEALSA